MRFLRSPKSLLSSLLFKSKCLLSRIPAFSPVADPSANQISIIHSKEAEQLIPKHRVKEFKESKTVSITSTDEKTEEKKEKVEKFYDESSWKKIKEISKDTSVRFSEEITRKNNFLGIASEVLVRGYKFSRKQKPEKEVTVHLEAPQS